MYSSNIQYPDAAKKEGKKLGAYILTYLRNGIIHPDEKLKRITSATVDAKWDAERLGLWYVATILLRLVDYTEEYMSPITWQTERVLLK